MAFYGIKTQVGRENLVTDILEMRIKHENIPVYSLIVIPGMKGYIVAEADSAQAIVDATRGNAHMLKEPLNSDDIFKLLETEPIMKELKEGMRIEVLGGPFKGAKAKILRVNKAKEEVTIELLEGTVPIPITIRAEFVRVIQ
ncbi:MAG: transcription elongation factor Spt5 [Candidatus Diapherotrites archaeon]|nr:transcription elongation factor Spt5 [Candidatus Diapherotrites archaeon]